MNKPSKQSKREKPMLAVLSETEAVKSKFRNNIIDDCVAVLDDGVLSEADVLRRAMRLNLNE